MWTQHHASRLAQQGIEVKLILIWKTLNEYAHSLQKRSYQLEKALPPWVRFHQNYYSFFNNFGAVKYKNYTEDHETTLRKACDFLDIPYFEGKERYWEKKHHSLWGNSSAEIHLYSKDSPDYKNLVRRNSGSTHSTDISISEKHHREIFYENPIEENFQHQIAEIRRKYSNLDQIEDMLNSRDVGNPDGWNTTWPNLQKSALEMQMLTTYKTVMELYRHLLFKVRYAD